MTSAVADVSRARVLAGLTDAEAERRIGERPRGAAPSGSRSYSSIAVANIFTVFNAILVAFAVLTLVFGDARDALFLGIVVANASIGIVQEVRAKRALDRLSALVAPTATVIRDGRPRKVSPDEVVVGDVLAVSPGDQLVADGRLLRADELRLDESILTGESEPVRRPEGAAVRSGAFVVEGTARYEVTAVGAESYAEQISGQARAFRHPRSPLELALNRLLLTLVAVMVPLGLVLGLSLVLRDTAFAAAVPKATAAMVSLVPEGLVLLASLTFAAAAVRMARRGALAQQLNAIESLAAADIICLDKTGTLTQATLRTTGVIAADGVDAGAVERAFCRYAAASPARNLTLEALAERWPAEPEEVVAHVPFASRRRWSALQFADTTLVLGAPELLADPRLRVRGDAHTQAGRRVVAIGATTSGLEGQDPESGVPPSVRPLGVAVLAERLRDDARETVAFLRSEGIELKILSGDAPATVGAIASDAGVAPRRAALDGSRLPSDDAAFRQMVAGAPAIGRISPDDKRRVVEALRDDGRYVAMVGDGVNDVPALKAARLAIAQGSGAQMARSVADVVLLSNDFSTVPGMVAEGRRILRNVQRVARIFVAKASFAAFLIITVGMTSADYPFLPRHLTIASTFSVGLPAFVLALAPSTGPWRSEGFLREVFRFAVPAGIGVAAGVLGAYLVALHVLGWSVAASRTVATTAMLAGMLFLVVELERRPARRHRLVELLAVTMGACYLAVLAIAPAREFFALVAPSGELLLVSAGGAATAWALSAAGLRISGADT